MTYEVEYTERARKSLAQTVDWVSERSTAAAGHWLDELEAVVQSLEINPERFSVAPEDSTHDVEIRQLLFRKRRDQYRVLFTIGDSKVVILDVRHSMREWLPPGELDAELE